MSSGNWERPSFVLPNQAGARQVNNFQRGDGWVNWIWRNSYCTDSSNSRWYFKARKLLIHYWSEYYSTNYHDTHLWSAGNLFIRHSLVEFNLDEFNPRNFWQLNLTIAQRINRISINLLAFYHESRALISLAEYRLGHCLRRGFSWTTNRFILKELDYSLSIYMRHRKSEFTI